MLRVLEEGESAYWGPSRPGRAGGDAGSSLRKWRPGAGRKTPPWSGSPSRPACAAARLPPSPGPTCSPRPYRGAVRIHVRASKTDPAGDRTDIRMAKNRTAEALDAIRNGAGDARPVFGLTPGQINRRVQAAAAAAGIGGISAHSFRVGLASELTARGASTTETMLAGGWSTARMVAHYSAGATAERGAVAKYL